MAHQLHEFHGFSDDRCSVPPGEHCSKEPRDLNILPFGEKMRNGNGILCDEAGLIVQYNPFIEELHE